MKSEWKVSTIEQVCNLVTDGAHYSPPSVERGEYMVSVKDFTAYGFDFTACRKISREDYDKLYEAGCVPQKKDILVGKDGARFFEDIILYKQEEKPALLSSIAILRVDEKQIIPAYLYYYLKSPNIKKDVRDNYGSGSAIPRIVLKDFKRMPVSYPPLPVQRKIASILSALDDKIETNNAICRNLEEQAKCIFKNNYRAGSDFIQGTIGDVVTLQRGYDLPKSKIQEGVYPVAGSTDIIAYHSEYNCDAPCIIMGRSGNVGKPRLYLEKVWAHNTSLFSKTFHESDPIWVYYSLLDMDFSTLMGGSAVPTLNRNHVHIQPLSIAPLQIQRAFSREVMPLLLLIDTVNKENKQLSELRNVLMPRLMSGEYGVDRLGLW